MCEQKGAGHSRNNDSPDKEKQLMTHQERYEKFCEKTLTIIKTWVSHNFKERYSPSLIFRVLEKKRLAKYLSVHYCYWCTITISPKTVNKQCEGWFPCCFSDYYFEGWAAEERPWSDGPSRHKYIQLYSTNGVWLDMRADRACGSAASWRRAPWCTNQKKTLWSKRGNGEW